MPRTISSAQTFLMKVIFPVLWIGGFSASTIMMFVAGEKIHDGLPHPPPLEMKWSFLAILVVAAVFIYRSCIRLKRVEITDSTLHISNYLREIVVPMRDLDEVTENRWVNIHPVTLHFKRRTEFGHSVVFMPTARWFAFFSSHPIVAELRALAARASTELR
jgi:hypothetical protein